MTIGVLQEPAFENRISLLPEQVATLTAKGIEVLVQEEAGARCFVSPDDYTAKGALTLSREAVLAQAHMLLSIHAISSGDLQHLQQAVVLTGIYQPLYNIPLMQQWAEKNITCFSMDMLPRITRAQTMDVLSSQASIAGYKAVLLAADLYPRYFPMLMTAAGSIAPAKLLVIGAGVAGLQAVATARRLGAVVEVFDTRAAVKEEVMSLGAKFVEVEGAADTAAAGGYAVEQSAGYLQRQKEKIAAAVTRADVVITTAQVPGKKAPLLITEEMLLTMKPGSVIIDLAAATGGNTALTRNNEIIRYHQVTIAGNSNLASSLPWDASRLYGRNILNFLALLFDKQNGLSLNFEDELVRGACITHGGKIVHEKIQQVPEIVS